MAALTPQVVHNNNDIDMVAEFAYQNKEMATMLVCPKCFLKENSIITQRSLSFASFQNMVTKKSE